MMIVLLFNMYVFNHYIVRCNRNYWTCVFSNKYNIFSSSNMDRFINDNILIIFALFYLNDISSFCLINLILNSLFLSIDIFRNYIKEYETKCYYSQDSLNMFHLLYVLLSYKSFSFLLRYICLSNKMKQHF